MDGPRLIRGLRIAWSVWWGILCVLLIVLWVRSFWRIDIVGVWNGYAVDSIPGTIGIDSNENDYGWRTISIEDLKDAKPILPSPVWGTFRLQVNPAYSVFSIPYWFATLLAASFDISAYRIPLRSQFSLRALLIATTLVALVLATAASLRLC
jgi:hypothetical protein